MSDQARVVVVRLCVEELWAARSDGRFAALEDALVDVLESKRKNLARAGSRKSMGTPPPISRSQAAPTPAGDNVIVLWTPERAARMRRKA
jgi:hypothetical protein